LWDLACIAPQIKLYILIYQNDIYAMDCMHFKARYDFINFYSVTWWLRVTWALTWDSRAQTLCLQRHHSAPFPVFAQLDWSWGEKPWFKNAPKFRNLNPFDGSVTTLIG
jgi:hypothetical protein